MGYKTLYLFLLFYFNSCIDITDNKNEIIKQRTDNESLMNCILFIKSGGATVGDSYQISIIPYQKKLSTSQIGNVFIADDHDGGIISDTSRVNFRWVTVDTLKISFDKRLRIFKMTTKTKDATIIYESFSLKK